MALPAFPEGGSLLTGYALMGFALSELFSLIEKIIFSVVLWNYSIFTIACGRH